MSLVELEDFDLRQYASRDVLDGPSVPVTAPFPEISAEATRVVLGLAAMREEVLLDEVSLVLNVRLRVDDVVHLWSEEGSAMRAAVVLNPRAHHMRLTLHFEPVGHSAIAAVTAAEFLQTLSQATHLALRLPDGQLAPDKVRVPFQLEVDEGLVRLLRLIADIARLANVDVPVPEHVDDELMKDLLVARRLLKGQTVRGRWNMGELRLERTDASTVREALEHGERHELLHVAPMDLDVQGTRVPLGGCVGSSLTPSSKMFAPKTMPWFCRVRACDGSASMTMTPVAPAPPMLEPHLVLPPAAFDELLADLDAPPRHTRLRDLL